ncbi:thermonuclease family protein [Synechococcus elongatus]|uniref:Thermonuclease family protein n=1 Tax=Synechococcus elongatus PCC 11802 TaxID=2283154 RepID=A0AAT9JYF6_SYNEL|nr:thermonuclease family protein [Synechococcus elongatus]
MRLRTINRDRFGRLIAEVFYQGKNVNLQMVREGQAVVYRQYLIGCDRNAYLPAELEAKAIGLLEAGGSIGAVGL